MGAIGSKNWWEKMGMYRGMVGMGMKCTLDDSHKCMHDRDKWYGRIFELCTYGYHALHPLKVAPKFLTHHPTDISKTESNENTASLRKMVPSTRTWKQTSQIASSSIRSISEYRAGLRLFVYLNSSSQKRVDIWGQWIHSKYRSSKLSGKQRPWPIGMSSS